MGATLIQTNSDEFSVLKKSTLLYLEDDEDIRKETLVIFEKYFKKVYSAEDGKIGLNVYSLHKDEIDIILTEYNEKNTLTRNKENHPQRTQTEKTKLTMKKKDNPNKIQNKTQKHQNKRQTN